MISLNHTVGAFLYLVCLIFRPHRGRIFVAQGNALGKYYKMNPGPTTIILHWENASWTENLQAIFKTFTITVTE